MEDTITPIEREFDGRMYVVHQFQGRACFKHFAALTKIIGEPLAHGLISAVSVVTKKSDSPVDYIKAQGLDKDMVEYIPAVADALSTLTKKLHPEELLSLFEALIKNTRIKEDGRERPIIFDLDFGGGRMKPLFKLFLFVLEVNFADFLPSGIDLATVVNDAVEAAKIKVV